MKQLCFDAKGIKVELLSQFSSMYSENHIFIGVQVVLSPGRFTFRYLYILVLIAYINKTKIRSMYSICMMHRTSKRFEK